MIIENLRLPVLAILLVLISASVSAQSVGKEGVIIEGKVVAKETGDPLPNAFVLIRELSVWAYSDERGEFKIERIPKGRYNIDITTLGYADLTIVADAGKDIKEIVLQLEEENLEIEEITVTAVTGKSINTSSVIGPTAIRHLQPSSLADIMQLLPGALTSNPSLTSKNDISIRSVQDPGKNNARGVALFMNGSRVFNDATHFVETETDLFNTLDYRRYSTDNIESVEVLKGILSAEYGDVTSGAVLVKTKAGKSPYEIRIKADPRTKAISFSKGFYLGGERGNLNVDADFAHAYKDARSPVDIFNRTTLGITYSNTFIRNNAPLRFNANLSGYLVRNNSMVDPDVSRRDFTKRRESNIALSIYGNWQLKRSWITSLNYNLSGRFSKENFQKFSINNGLPQPTINSMSEGIREGWFTGELDEFDRRNEELPLYLSGKVSAFLNREIAGTIFRTMAGIEFNSKGNRGRGTYYTGSAPQYFRERPYSDIPFMNDISVYAEERVAGKLFGRDFEISAGARVTKMMIKGYSYKPTIDPRSNVKYSLFPYRGEGVFREITLRGGWGLMNRLPAIGLLYPAPAYIDIPLFQYRNSSSGQSLAVIQTEIVDNRLQYELKPVKTRNVEIGADIDIVGIKTRLTWFNERLKNGITDNYSYLTSSYDYYSSVTDPNASPVFREGKVWIKNNQGEYIPLDYTTYTEFKQYSTPDNRGETKKWGLEYEFDFGRIKSLNTSIILSGAYIYQLDGSPGLRREYISITDPVNNREKLPYVGIYESKAHYLTVGDGSSRFNSNLHIITNIPSIRLVISLVGQFIWVNDKWNIYDKERIYMLDNEGNRVYGDWGGERVDGTLYRNPDFYMDKNGNIRSFEDYYTTTDPDLKKRLQMLILSSSQPYYFQKSGYKPYFMANLRITKEIGNLASLSFYANNFTNSRPIMKLNTRPSAAGSRMNTEIYFGAELRLTF